MASAINLTYHRRLFLGLVIYSWLLVGCFALFQYNRERKFKAEELNGRLQMVNEMIINHLDSTGNVRLPSESFPDLRVSVIDPRGKVIYDNTLDKLPGTSHLDREEIAQALKYGEGHALRRHSESTGLTYFYSAKKGHGYLVRTAVPYSVSLNRLLAADYAFLWFMVGVTVVMCVIGFAATRRLGKNVERLRDFARKAEHGERIAGTEPFPHDELGDISSHIVRLYAKLQQALTERDREHRRTLHEQKEKARIKRQLTNNINHELKTPVASMQVCLETLSEHPDMTPARRTDFINRCLEANRRLGRLLADVSTLTRIEDGSDNINADDTDVSAIIAEVCREYEEKARRMNIEIVNRVSSPLIIRGNASLISSVFHNLFSNAIAYSEGNRIEVSADSDGTLRFSDNGRGVAPEHLDKIFERFYRIDKGRSRRLGGTGLGLSIVRNAVLWHGGHISAENRPEGGLQFTFTLGVRTENCYKAGFSKDLISRKQRCNIHERTLCVT